MKPRSVLKSVVKARVEKHKVRQAGNLKTTRCSSEKEMAD